MCDGIGLKVGRMPPAALSALAFVFGGHHLTQFIFR
jgi:hypothetical protein